ncbi:MAG: ABC transporter permease [Rhodobacteraceae bacterium]|nr:ABC transporter permease [Paracoccaceae bacterium]
MTAMPLTQRPASALSRFLHRHEAWRGWLLLAPAFCLMLVAILFQLGSTLAMSTWSLDGYSVDRTPTLGNYSAMLGQPMFSALIGRSLVVATFATVVTVALCYPMAYFVAFHVHRHKALWLILLTLPFWTSYLLRVFAWKVVLGYEGVLNTALIGLGIVQEPLAALLYSQTAVTLVLAHSWAAFAILPTYVSLEKIDRSCIEAAADLGDGPMRRFWRITFPLSLPGVVAAFFMMFGPMDNWPAGATLSVVMIVTIGLAGLAFLAVGRLVGR